jgi:hypothetical protein
MMTEDLGREIDPLPVEGIERVLSQYDVALDGENHRVRFSNGYGASIIRNRMSHGGKSNLWELAVICFTGGWEDWYITGATPVVSGDGIIGWLTVDGVAAILLNISRLPRGEEN